MASLLKFWESRAFASIPVLGGRYLRWKGIRGTFVRRMSRGVAEGFLSLPEVFTRS